MYEGLDREGDKNDEETRHCGVVYRGSETEGKIGVGIRKRGDPEIQGKEKDGLAIEVV